MANLRTVLLAGCIATTSFLSIATASQAELSLPAAIKSASMVDPNIAALTQDVTNAGISIEAERDAFFPSFQFSGGTTQDGGPELSLTATQVLYDWGKTKNLIASASQDRVMAVSELKKGIEDLAYDVGVLFLEAETNETKIRLSELYVAFAEKMLAKVEGRVKAGLADRSEATRAQLEVAKAKNTLIRAESNLGLSLSQIGNLAGVEVDAVLPSRTAPIEKFLEVVGGLDPVIENAPDVSVAMAEVSKAETAIKLAKASRLPTINLKARGGRSIRDNRNSSSIGVFFDMDLGSRTVRGRDLQSAEVSLQAALSRLEGEKRLLRNDAETSLEMVNILSESAQIQARQVKETVSVLLAYEEQFEAGTRDLIDTLTMGQELYALQVELLDLLQEIKAMEFQTARDLGVLVSFIGR